MAHKLIDQTAAVQLVLRLPCKRDVLMLKAICKFDHGILVRRTSPTGLSAATTVGRYVTIGQSCVLRSATVEDEVLIGEKCVLMEGSLVENHCILAPGTVLPPGRLVPSGQLWAGNPAKFVRNLTKDEVCTCWQASASCHQLCDWLSGTRGQLAEACISEH